MDAGWLGFGAREQPLPWLATKRSEGRPPKTILPQGEPGGFPKKRAGAGVDSPIRKKKWGIQEGERSGLSHKKTDSVRPGHKKSPKKYPDPKAC